MATTDQEIVEQYRLHARKFMAELAKHCVLPEATDEACRLVMAYLDQNAHGVGKVPSGAYDRLRPAIARVVGIDIATIAR